MVKTVDLGVLEAIASYIYLGLEPGSFTECLICGGDIEELYSKANELIKRDDIIENMVHFVNVRLPDVCKGRENYLAWIEHSGLSKAPLESNVTFKLDGGTYWIKNYKNSWELQ